MIVRKRRGRRTLRCLAGLMACSFFINTTYAWQQEYIAEAAPGHTTERYTWTAITNRITTTYWPNVFSLRKIRWVRCLAWRMNPA